MNSLTSYVAHGIRLLRIGLTLYWSDARSLLAGRLLTVFGRQS